MTKPRSTAGERGMTLIEISVAIAILSGMVTMMVLMISSTVRGRDIADRELAQPKVANQILGQIFKDFRYIWWGGMTGDVGFLGKSGTRAGMDADTVQFVTARHTRLVGAEDDGRQRDNDRPSPLTEVGYALKTNDTSGGGRWLELWRREDYFVDDKPSEGGTYNLVYDRIRKFDMRYFDTPDQQRTTDNQGAEEWDSRIKHGVPYAIILSIEFDVEDPEESSRSSDRPLKLVRIILLRNAYGVRWTSNETEPAR